MNETDFVGKTHLCLGSFIRTIAVCTIRSERALNNVCKRILMALSDDGETVSYRQDKGNVVTYSDSNFEKIHNSTQNPHPNLLERSKNYGHEAIRSYFADSVIPTLDAGMKNVAVATLIAIIQNDESINEDASIGVLSGFTKGDLTSRNTFKLDAFLADVFIYAACATTNDIDKDFTKSIKKDFCVGFEGRASQIRFYEKSTPAPMPAELETAVGKFEDVFTRVSCMHLGIQSEHDYKIYRLGFDDHAFNYDALWEHLLANIGYYLFSRSQIKDLESRQMTATISQRAIARLKEYSTLSNVEELGKLLLYVFLEQVLGAPKLMSQIEIGKTGQAYPETSSGVHILLNSRQPPFSQYVVGTSVIEGSLNIALKNAFEGAKKLNGHGSELRRFIESPVFLKSLPEDVCKQLETIILPSEGDCYKPETAYGIFVGYTIDSPDKSSMTIMQYQEEMVKIMERDIAREVAHIESLIEQNDLAGHSLYIYLLPFTDAVKDANLVMDRLSGKGV